jgi:protein dithiol:quinone oxidoreductase
MIYYLISFYSFALIAIALFLQHVGYQDVLFNPCPLCILQRIAFITLGIFSLFAGALPRVSKIFVALAGLSGLAGVGLSARHVWLLLNPQVSCGLDPLEIWINHFELTQKLDWLLKADGLCTAPLPHILGLQVPVWSLINFIIVTVGLFFLIRRK